MLKTFLVAVSVNANTGLGDDNTAIYCTLLLCTELKPIQEIVVCTANAPDDSINRMATYNCRVTKLCAAPCANKKMALLYFAIVFCGITVKGTLEHWCSDNEPFICLIQ